MCNIYMCNTYHGPEVSMVYIIHIDLPRQNFCLIVRSRQSFLNLPLATANLTLIPKFRKMTSKLRNE